MRHYNSSMMVKRIKINLLVAILLSMIATQPIFAIDPRTEPIPLLDLNNPAKSILVRLDFARVNGIVTVERDEDPEVVLSPPPQRIGGPPHLMIKMLDINGQALESINVWDPLMVYQMSGGYYKANAPSDTGPALEWVPFQESVKLLDLATGHFLLPFRSDAKTMQLIDRRQQNAVLTEVNLEPIITQFCTTHPDDFECQQAASIFFAPDPASTIVNQNVVVEIRVDKMVNLYGMQLAINFNPTMLQVVDTNLANPGVQSQLGDFMTPDTIIINQSNNSSGLIQYGISLQGVKPGLNGSGIVGRITFRAIKQGISTLTITQHILSDPQSQAISHSALNGQVEVKPDPYQEPNAGQPISGTINLERRQSDAGATVCLTATQCQTVASDGKYRFEFVQPGNYSITVNRMSYLSSQHSYTVGNTPATVPQVTMLGGDVNQDSRIDRFDVVLIGQAWSSTPGAANWDRRADITDDDSVNVLDAVAPAFNLDKNAPGPWNTTHLTAVSSRRSQIVTSVASSTTVVISPSQGIVSVGDSIELQLEAHDVISMTAWQGELNFDPKILQVEDVDPDTSGIQIIPGEFLDPISQFVAINEANNTSGTIKFLATLIYPGLPSSGSGQLAKIRFKAVGEGNSSIIQTKVFLVDDSRPDPHDMPTTIQNGSVTVRTNEKIIFLPVITK